MSSTPSRDSVGYGYLEKLMNVLRSLAVEKTVAIALLIFLILLCIATVLAQWFWVKVLLTALIPGLLATWLGVGGCFLRIPMIMYFFDIPIKSAYCINQAVIALTTIPGVYTHVRNGHVYWKGFVVAAISAAVGVALGAYVVAKFIPGTTLRVFFGFVCVGIGMYIAIKTIKARRKLVKRITVFEVKKLEHGKKLAILMFLAGFATGLCGFGGGIYFVPIYMGLGYSTHIAIGTSSAQMIPVAGLGSSVLTYLGWMRLELFIAIGIPTLIASWIGAKLTTKSPPWILRLVYAASIIGAGLYVAIDTLTKI